MKKILAFIFSIFMILSLYTIEPKAIVDESDYLTYQEITLSSGKLIKNFTESDYNELFNSNDERPMFGIILITSNQNVEASYIASVKECMKNDGETPIEITVNYQIETNTKVSFSASGSLSGSGGANVNKIKTEAAAKAGVEYSKTTTESVKESKSIKLTVEPHSQYILYTKGNLRVTNGCGKVFYFWICIYDGAFEIITLESQYGVFEKKDL